MITSGHLGALSRMGVFALLLFTSALNASTISHTVNLSWTPSSGSSVAGYWVYRATSSGGPYTRVSPQLVAVSSYTDNSVQVGSKYFYVVTAVDGNSNESTYSNEISLTIPATTGFIDYSVDNASRTSTVPQNGTVLIGGWAADENLGSPVSSVQVSIDGSVIGNAVLGGSRPDVASVYGRSDFTNSGWSVSYNIGTLTVGTHNGSALAYDSRGAASQLRVSQAASATFNVTSEAANAAPFGFLDSAFNLTDGSNSVPQTGTVRILGWSADPDTGAPVARVEVMIDGSTIGTAILGFSRADVADAYGRSDFMSSGWQIDYSVATLSAGIHTVSAIGYDSQGSFATLRKGGTFQGTFTVTK